MSTKERIVTKALELFNNKGVEYVGMRELAASLDTKLGNITYYFPTKEDLIARISTDLSEQNSKILQPDENITMYSYLEMTKKHFESQYQYRCLFLSFVNLMKQYEKIALPYKTKEDKRRKTTLANLENLAANNYLKPLSEGDKSFLLSSILLISRFWISDAALSQNKLKPAAQINHYLNHFANTLRHYSTAKGEAEIIKFIGK